jgi:putative flippase GtrA
MIAKIWPFIKFCLTGGLNTVLSYVVYALFVGVMHVPYSSALAVGYIVGMITSFILNTLWTFEKSKLDITYLWRFLLVNLLLLLFSEEGLHLLIKNLHLSAYLAQAINLVPQTLLGFFLNKLFVFKDTMKKTNEDTNKTTNDPTETEVV